MTNEQILAEALRRFRDHGNVPVSGPTVAAAYEAGPLRDDDAAIYVIGYLIDMVQEGRRERA